MSFRLLVSSSIAVLPTCPSPAKDKKKDPDEIGNRDVGKGLNFYSLEKEIALGKSMAQEVERDARILWRPGLMPPTSRPCVPPAIRVARLRV